MLNLLSDTQSSSDLLYLYLFLKYSNICLAIYYNALCMSAFVFVFLPMPDVLYMSPQSMDHKSLYFMNQIPVE